MIKKSIRIISMVCSCLICVSAVILLVDFFTLLSNIGNFSNMDATSIIYVLIRMLTVGLLAAVSGIIGGFGIKAFIVNEEPKYLKYYPAIFVVLYFALLSFVYLVFFGFRDSSTWVHFILSAGGAVVLLLVLFGKQEESVKTILQFVGLGLAFIVTILLLSIGVDKFLLVVNLFIIMAFIAMNVLVLILNNNGESKKALNN